MAAVGLLVAVFCVSVLHAVHSLRIVGHAIGGSETLEREKFEISSKADPNDGVQGDKRKLTEKQAVVMFQVKPVDDDDSEGMGGEIKAMPNNRLSECGEKMQSMEWVSPKKHFEAEAERSDSVGDVSKAMRKALGNAVAEFLPGSRSDSQR